MGETPGQSVSRGSGLGLQESLRVKCTAKRYFPNCYPRIKGQITGRLLPGKHTGLERVNVFSPPLTKALQIKVLSIAFTAIAW